jgi:hypothetical protein
LLLLLVVLLVLSVLLFAAGYDSRRCGAAWRA